MDADETAGLLLTVSVLDPTYDRMQSRVVQDTVNVSFLARLI